MVKFEASKMMYIWGNESQKAMNDNMYIILYTLPYM